MPTTKEQKLDGWVSVTEVLDFFIHKKLLDWYLKTGKAEAKRMSTVALKIGSRVDALIQEDFTNGGYKLKSDELIEVRNCMEAWESFKRDYNPMVKGIQIPLIDEDFKLIGNCDLLLNNRIVDVKCATSIKANYWLQVSKYADMIQSYETEGVAILRLDKNLGTYQFVTNEQAKENWEKCACVFNGLLEAYRYYNRPKDEGE